MYKCIEMMEEREKNLFDQLESYYKKTLDTPLVINDIAFTPHDYSHHCNNLYKISSDLIFNDASYKYFKEKPEFLLAYNLAVLLHDISMTDELCDRNKHSEESVQRLKREKENDADHPLNRLSATTYGLLCDIIRSHSDIKGVKSEKTLETIKRNYGDGSRTDGKERVALCAAFRLADELDISADRISSVNYRRLKRYVNDNNAIINSIQTREGDIELFLDKLRKGAKTEEFSEWSANELFSAKLVAMAADSLKHWDFCNYIESVQFAASVGNKLLVICNKEEIEREGDGENVLRVLKDKQDKLNAKIENDINSVLRDLVSREVVNKILNSVTEVQFVVGNKRIDDLIIVEEEITSKKKEYTINEICIEEGSEKYWLKCEISEKLTKWVQEGKLLDTGHYFLDSNVCSRDWILMDDIMLDKQKLDIIIKYLYEHIRVKYSDILEELYIVGLDFNGMLLASRIAFLLGCPFSYIIPKHSVPYHGEQDKRVDLLEGKKVLVIYDVLIDLKMLLDSEADFKEHGLEVMGIYSVFYRKKVGRSQIKSDYPIYTLNDSFDTEIVDSSNCKYKMNGCLRKNPILL